MSVKAKVTIPTGRRSSAMCGQPPGRANGSDWTVADLVRHIGGVQYWVAATVERRAKERIPFSEVPQPPQDQGAVIDWFAAATGSLLIALEEAGPDELAWNFAKGPDQPVRWWYRRQAAEVAG